LLIKIREVIKNAMWEKKKEEKNENTQIKKEKKKDET
jgi:hypothetical protein